MGAFNFGPEEDFWKIEFLPLVPGKRDFLRVKCPARKTVFEAKLRSFSELYEQQNSVKIHLCWSVYFYVWPVNFIQSMTKGFGFIFDLVRVYARALKAVARGREVGMSTLVLLWLVFTHKQKPNECKKLAYIPGGGYSLTFNTGGGSMPRFRCWPLNIKPNVLGTPNIESNALETHTKLHDSSFFQIYGTKILNFCPCCNSQTPNIDLT